jgi:hypothetical protein
MATVLVKGLILQIEVAMVTQYNYGMNASMQNI